MTRYEVLINKANEFVSNPECIADSRLEYQYNLFELCKLLAEGLTLEQASEEI